MNENWRFFEKIPNIHSISEITNLKNYYPVPDDWIIALTDVRGSTKAIQNGKYKDVNAVAAASITALLNHMPEIDVPFIFGGDGATILVPPEIREATAEALLATQKMSLQQFGLDLRAGIVPVKDVRADGYDILVARLSISENFNQAIFTGGGLGYADKLLKDPVKGEQYAIKDAGNYQADFSGFECRWNKIRSPYQETISLIITAVRGDAATHNQIYHETLEKIESIYGNSNERHPIRVENLHLALNPYSFYQEARIKYQDGGLRKLLELAYTTLKGRIAIRFNINNWGSYPALLIATTDNEKFDDTLRMIISGTEQQQQQLRQYLDHHHHAGDLVYGIHTSQYALMTCIVFDHFGKQVHFLDGADGGYALAAKEMKAQLAAMKSTI